MVLNLDNFTRSDIISCVSVIASLMSALYTIRVNKKLHMENINLKKQSEDEQKLKPYQDLIIQTYFKFDNVFRDISSTACSVTDQICKYTDIFCNNNHTNKMALSNHLNIIPEIFVNNNEEDILWQPIEYVMHSKLGIIQSTSSLDLKNNNYNEQEIEFHLKCLYENFDLSKKDEYCKVVKRKISTFHDIYHNNKEEIDKSIEELQKAIAKFKRYDFVEKTTTYVDLKELLNLLLYIKKCSESFYTSDDKYIFLSNLAANLSELAIINKGILEMLKFK